MIRPDADDVLAVVIETLEQDIAPHVQDEYAGSLCLTVGQLLRSVRARIAHEGPALSDDNRELRGLLTMLRDVVPGPVVEEIDRALGVREADGYCSVAQLQDEALTLRRTLVEAMRALEGEPDGAAREAIRLYLQHQLDRQRPWLVDPVTGPWR